MTSKIRNETNRLTHIFSGKVKPKTAVDVLLKSGQISDEDLLKAIALQQHHDADLHETLRGLNLVDEDLLLDAISQEYALPRIDLLTDPPDSKLATMIPPTLGIKYRFIPWKSHGDQLIVALSSPQDCSKVRELLSAIAPKLQFVLTSRSSILRYYESKHVKYLSNAANQSVPEDLSCRTWTGQKTRWIGIALMFFILLFIGLFPHGAIVSIYGWIICTLMAKSTFNLFILASHFRSPTPMRAKGRPAKLPKITILLPLLHEEDIVDRLIKRMSGLSYPKELLEILLVYEETDIGTRDHLNSRSLPYWVKKLQVPADTLQTKPRAMNYALDFCSGDIIGIYDAEDAPDPQQLYRVAQSFDTAAENIACVQCQLDFYNTDTNWISRCFTLEYATLFRVILPQLERLKLPMPLGGTSVFFRRDILEKLGRWDAHNVTEDADLGVRLRRLGYRCLWLDSTTYEEANFRTIPWIKQRSRWLKGFLQTWMTHMRHPMTTLMDLGPVGFVVLQLQTLGTFTGFAAIPFVLPLWLYTFGFSVPNYDDLPLLMIAIFILTEILSWTLSTIACYKRNSKHLIKFIPLYLIYSPLGSLAAYKALWELFMRPNYWEKTAHGINDTDYQDEIDRLTLSPEDSENTCLPLALTVNGG